MIDQPGGVQGLHGDVQLRDAGAVGREGDLAGQKAQVAVVAPALQRSGQANQGHGTNWSLVCAKLRKRSFLRQSCCGPWLFSSTSLSGKISNDGHQILPDAIYCVWFCIEASPDVWEADIHTAWITHHFGGADDGPVAILEDSMCM